MAEIKKKSGKNKKRERQSWTQNNKYKTCRNKQSGVLKNIFKKLMKMKISVQVERRKSVEIKYHFYFIQVQVIKEDCFRGRQKSD